MLVLFGLNAYICGNLFLVQFTQRMESIESSYMSISRYAMNHWGELNWFPLWFAGMPFHRVYQPGLHLTVAALATWFHQTPQHLYHVITAMTYSLGAVTLFWLFYRAMGSRGYALAVGLLYSLISPACFLVPSIRADIGGLLLPRRYQILVHYGEGPHITAVMMIPLIIFFLDKTISDRRWLFVPAAILALCACVLTNWTGTVGLSMAIVSYCASRMGRGALLDWLVLVGVAAVAYLIACPWIPPSIITSVLRNSQESYGTTFRAAHVLYGLSIAAVFAGMHFIFERLRTDRWMRFFLYFSLLTGVVVLGREWAGWFLLPQPNRFQVEMEMAFIASAVWCAKLVLDRSPRWVRIAAVAALALFCVMQFRHYRYYARAQTQPIQIENTIEYRMAKWFDAHMQGRRVFAPGNISLWMNMFTDVPQVAGCCDQSIPTFEHRIAVYAIYTGQNAGARDAEFSLLWLRAYGADAIAVTGPKSTEYYKPYRHPEKFRGVLPELWRDNEDDVIYDIPRHSRSLVHVIEPSQVVRRAPANGLDIEPLVPYVAALENPAMPVAAMTWKNPNQARIDTTLQSGQVLAVQVSYDPGWRAIVNGMAQPIKPDPLGLMVIDPGCTGPCSVELVYDGGSEARWMRLAQGFGVVALLVWAYASRRRRLPAPGPLLPV